MSTDRSDTVDVEDRVRRALDAAARTYQPRTGTGARLESASPVPSRRRQVLPAAAVIVLLVVLGALVAGNRTSTRGGETVAIADEPGGPGGPAPDTAGELILVPPAPEPGGTVTVYFPDGPVSWGPDSFELRHWDGQAWGEDLLAPDPNTVTAGAARSGLADRVELPVDLEDGWWQLCARLIGNAGGDRSESTPCATFPIGTNAQQAIERGRYLDDTIALADLETEIEPVNTAPFDALLAEADLVAVVTLIATSPELERRTDPDDVTVTVIDDRITIAVLRTLQGILPYGLTEIAHPALIEPRDGTTQRVPLPDTGALATALAAIETGDTPAVLIGLEPHPTSPELWRIVRPDLITVVDGIEDRSLPPLVDPNVVDRFCSELGGRGAVCRVNITDLDSTAVDAVADPTDFDAVLSGACSDGGAPGASWALCIVPLNGQQAVIGRDLDDAGLTVRVQIGTVHVDFPLDTPTGVATLVDIEADRYEILDEGTVVGSITGLALLTTN